MKEAGIWEQAGLELESFEYCARPPEAEKALFNAEIDFISGNHLTPYALVVQGKPIVSLASPVNATNASIVSREPVGSLQDLKGLRIVDTPAEGRDGGFHHVRGNHMMYLIRAGVGIEDVHWVEYEGSEEQFQALKAGKADAMFAGGGEKYKQQGFHVLSLPPLPMINGPTLTTSYTVLNKKKDFGERLVKAQVLAIHFAHTQRNETERILENLSQKTGRSYRYSSLEKMPRKPYPDPQAVINAYDLGCIKNPEAKQLSPLALWDLHYLRQLDNSGFIDGLYGRA
jgi:ABC-type nitrate/sulfonate/bicarbonate transport system substrate-binding protein